MELILEAGNCNNDATYAFNVVEEVARLRDLAPDGLDVLLKVQMYSPWTLTTRTAPRYDNTSGDAKNQWDLFENAIDYVVWKQVKREADLLGVPMFASVFDHQAIEAAVDMGMTRLKIASGDITYLHLIEHARDAITRINGDLYVSTGAADYDDIADITDPLWDGAILMACHLAYPTTEEMSPQLARIEELRHATNNRYPIGYSDHTMGYYTLPLLFGRVHCWEKHFTLTPMAGYGDHTFAIPPGGVEGLFDDYRHLAHLWGSPNLTPTEAEAPARANARRGLYAKTIINKGEKFTMGNVAVLRPAEGARPANELGMVLGKEAKKGYEAGDAL